METVKYLFEEWRDIPGYEGLYQASTLGRIKSYGWLIPCSKNQNAKQYKKAYILKPYAMGKYLGVALSINGVRKRFYVHRLIALTFIPNPQNLPYINHKDENKYNNVVCNLEWCDAKYNQSYGSRKGWATLSNSKPILQLTLNGEVVREWDSAVQANKELGVNKASISHCLCGLAKTAGGYKWQYK